MGWLDEQVRNFAQLRPAYLAFAGMLEEILEKVRDLYAPGGRVDSRAKAMGSFAEKALRKRAKYDNPLEKMTDLAGARVVALTLEDVKNCCRFIESEPGFLIDWENSVNLRSQLKTGMFGYNAVHYVIELSGSRILGVPVPEEIRPVPGGRSFRAEIQLQTMLQNVWSLIGHDRLYKTSVRVPASLQREINSVAAMLEAADRAFARSVADLDHYIRNFRAYRTPRELEDDIQMWRAVIAEAPHDRGAVYQLGARLMAAERWDEAFGVLSSLSDSKHSDVLRDLGECALRASSASGEKARGYLKRACESSKKDFMARCLLAEALRKLRPDKAISLYEEASETAPGEPAVLIPLIECRIKNDGSLEKLELAGKMLSEALGICRERAARGVYLPQAYFHSARLHLYRGDSYAALNSYAKAAGACHMPGEMLKELKAVSGIAEALSGGREASGLLDMEYGCGFELARRMLILCIHAKSFLFGPEEGPAWDAWDNARRSVRSLLEDTGSSPALRKRGFNPPVVFVAGSCDPRKSRELEQNYGAMFRKAFKSFSGTIISGGTDSGISGMAGRLRPGAGKKIRRIAYLPDINSLPKTDRVCPAYEIRPSPGKGYDPAGVMAAWADAFLEGIKPAQVRVFAIGGGILTGFELQLAAALGAVAGAVEVPGTGSRTLLGGECEPAAEGGATVLPPDSGIWHAFVNGYSPGIRFPGKGVEQAARMVHEQFRQENSDSPSKHDVSVLSWEKLPEEYRNSNRRQVIFARVILEAAGFDVVPADKNEKLDPKNPPVPDGFSKKITEMARLEHGRFCAERLVEGWRYAPQKNLKRKFSPYLVPWEQLDKKTKKLDADAVRNFPGWLASAGLKIVPRGR